MTDTFFSVVRSFVAFNVPMIEVFSKTALDPTVKVGKIIVEETYRLPVTLTLPPTLTLFKTDKLVVETLIRVARPATFNVPLMDVFSSVV